MPVVPYEELIERILKRERKEICFVPGAATRAVFQDAGRICIEAFTDELECQVYTSEHRGSAHLLGRTFGRDGVCNQYFGKAGPNFSEIGPFDLAELVLHLVESFRQRPAKFEVLAKIARQSAPAFEPDLQFSSGIFESIQGAKAAFCDELDSFDLADCFSREEIMDGLIFKIGTTDIFGGGFCEIERFPIVQYRQQLAV